MQVIYTAPTRQHELDHTDHTDHTDHGYICPEISQNHQVRIDGLAAEVCNLPGVETSSAEKAIATLREARKQSPLTGIFCRLGVPLGVRVVRLLETVTVFQHGPYPLPASAGRKFYAWSMAEAADAVIVQ